MKNVLNETATSVLSPAVNGYVDRYRSLAKSTAKAIIALAQTLVEAKATLNPVDFYLFCKEVALEMDGAVYKKIMAIGAKASRFEPCLERLPSAWTTIYELSKLEAHEFAELEKSNALSPLMTAKELKDALGKQASKTSIAKKEPDFVIDVANLDTLTKGRILDALFKLKDEFHFSVKVNETVTDEVIAFKTRLAA